MREKKKKKTRAPVVVHIASVESISAKFLPDPVKYFLSNVNSLFSEVPGLSRCFEATFLPRRSSRIEAPYKQEIDVYDGKGI